MEKNREPFYIDPMVDFGFKKIFKESEVDHRVDVEGFSVLFHILSPGRCW